MDWCKESIAELKAYRARVAAIPSLEEEIEELKYAAISIGSTSGTEIRGSGSTDPDGKILNLIVKRDKLEVSLATARKSVERTERALKCLTDEERMILEFSFISPAKGNTVRLGYELGLEKSAVYNRRNAALKHYTEARYGCTEAV